MTEPTAYRGYLIVLQPNGSYTVERYGAVYARVNSTWSGVIYIDEMLSP